MLIKSRMHPRNIYKTPPDFKELAINYPEFRKYVKQELSGKVTIDYQNQNALKALTCSLLKKDFNLDVEINNTRLIPRIPLCLNYILWVEDLLTLIRKNQEAFGIDIGTGCACIYSLLAARKHWKMLATEVDEENFNSAQNNIIRNNLLTEISVKLVPSCNQLLIGVIDDKTNYDFCMCNPPFFNHNEKPQDRTFRRQKIESISSEVPVEVFTEGGEISFVTKLIKESEKLQTQVKIYTTLIGKKSDFLVLKKEIQNVSPKSVTFTEFGQGRTIRWGLAWTFLDIDLKNHQSLGLSKIHKKKSKPLKFMLSKSTSVTLNKVFEDLKKLLTDLKITYNEENFNESLGLYFKAYENNWSHQRQKKRSKARAELIADKIKLLENKVCEEDDNSEGVKSKKPKLDIKSSVENEHPCIVEGAICLQNKESSINIAVSWISGNKESLHQIFQYIKNYWKDKNVLV